LFFIMTNKPVYCIYGAISDWIASCWGESSSCLLSLTDFQMIGGQGPLNRFRRRLT
jgi:hypothetical protein